MRRSSARLLIVGFLALLLIAAGAFALSRRGHPVDVVPRDDKPALMLLTTLPIVFPEEFSIEGAGSKTLSALETRYRVVSISTSDSASLRQARLLLLAHPLAQTPEALVDLDRWVRNGGKVLLLADPLLEWPSERPLGDKLRPPPTFADTGLLAHWGLTLEPPATSGLKHFDLAGKPVVALSPGALAGSCQVTADRFVADCKVGRGRAIVVADADFLNSEALGEDGTGNLDALLTVLERLER